MDAIRSNDLKELYWFPEQCPPDRQPVRLAASRSILVRHLPWPARARSRRLPRPHRRSLPPRSAKSVCTGVSSIQVVCCGWRACGRPACDAGKIASRAACEYQSNGTFPPLFEGGAPNLGLRFSRWPPSAGRRRSSLSDWPDRHGELEDGAMRRIGARPQSSAVSLDDRATDRQSQAQSAGLRRVEGFEEVFLHF